MKPIVKILVIFFLITGFTGYSQQKVAFKSATEPEHGFNPENPVAVCTPYKLKSSKKMDYFLEGLRTKNGEKLVVIDISSISNPNYKKPAILLHNFITGEVINKGNGRFLKKITLKEEKSDKTYELYVNNHIKENLRIPRVFSFQATENY